jgi:redox-regulated HSP33 family molecular chaperone
MVSKINTPANSNIYSTQDAVVPFQIDTAHITGRMIRCQKSISRILNQHNYPVPVARLLGEALLLVALLGSGMKLKHRMILQIKGDGALPLLVADYYADGSMRGYVECKDDLYQKLAEGNQQYKKINYVRIKQGYGQEVTTDKLINHFKGDNTEFATVGFSGGCTSALQQEKLMQTNVENDA